MDKTTALIFGAMDYGDWSFLAPLHQQSVAVFCADGGLYCARRAGFAPDQYIGDGDSGGEALPGLPSTVLPTQKDLTDLQAAWEQAYALGYRRIVLTGCTGGRQDHHISALQLLETIAHRGCEAVLLDPENEISFYSPGVRRLSRGAFRYFSLLPVDAQVELSITGAKYELCNRTVRRGDSLCVSNEFRDDTVHLTLTGGSCLLVLSQRIK